MTVFEVFPSVVERHSATSYDSHESSKPRQATPQSAIAGVVVVHQTGSRRPRTQRASGDARIPTEPPLRSRKCASVEHEVIHVPRRPRRPLRPHLLLRGR